MARAYPGWIVRKGAADARIVRAVQTRLGELGIPAERTGKFDRATEAAVRLFQARFADTEGIPLRIDGEVGPLTWAVLFAGHDAAAPAAGGSALSEQVMRVAFNQLGVMEAPVGSNRGPQVDEYLRAVGIDPARGSHAWCVAFVYWCFRQASLSLDAPNPMTKTAGVLALWRAAGRSPQAKIIRAADSMAKIDRIARGQIFAISTGGGFGHAGLVDGIQDGKLVTIEGNTNDGGSREGIGVFRRTSRTIASVNLGFIGYA
jgi:peptidoglycan hydrolase-like protein with peptidoglycan-binding domain